MTRNSSTVRSNFPASLVKPGAISATTGAGVTTLNGNSRNGVGGLNANTGATSGPSFGNAASPTLGLAVNDDGSLLFGAGGTWRNAVSAWNTSLSAWLAAIAAHSTLDGMALLHSDSALSATPDPDLVTTLSIDALVATQRRRLRK